MTPYAVDSNVLSELLLGGPRAQDAVSALERALEDGIVASVWVAAEILAVAPSESARTAVLEDMGIIADYDVSDAILTRAAVAWRAYLDRRRHERDTFSCPSCGLQQDIPRCTNCRHGPRRILTDFLIGAHAIQRAQALITWDRGVYATYFPELAIVDPSAGT